MSGWRAFGGMLGLDQEARFALGAWSRPDGQTPVLNDALVSFSCRVFQLIEHASHLIVIGAVERVTPAEGAALQPSRSITMAISAACTPPYNSPARLNSEFMFHREFTMAQDSAKLVKLPRRTALKQTTLSESVYAEIRSRLQRGEIGPNDRVLDYEVAEEFDCTRMPVRQALLRLVSEGYLIGTTRGFVTPTLTNDDIHEIFEVRRLLEPSAARAPSPSWTIARTPRSSAPSRRQSRPTTSATRP